MIKPFLAAAAVCIATTGMAQKKADPSVFAKSITTQDLKKHLSIVASAEMEGRNTPSPGLEKTAEYITAQFKAMGLAPGNNGSYRQTYQLKKDSLTALELTIDGIKFEAFKDVAPLYTNNEDIQLKYDEYAFVGYGIVDNNRDDYTGLDVKGKLVVLVSGTPKGFTPSQQGRMASTSMSSKIRNAWQKGAAAVFITTENIPPFTKNTVGYKPDWENETGPKEAPVFFIGSNVVEKVSNHSYAEMKEALDNGQVTLQMNQAPVTLNYKLQNDKATASNVLGVIEGTDKKDEYLFITAHYDHVGKDAEGNIYYGADDDGSGTVSVLEMAQAFALAKKAGKGPRRTIVFMTVSGEEKGLWGSEYYSEHPVFPLDKTTADLNIDMIGRVDTERETADTLNYIYVIGHDKLSTDLPVINEDMNNKYTKLVLDYKFDDPNDQERIYYRSDHYNFARKGVPILFFYDGMLKADYHKPTDTIEKINFPLMAKRAQMIFYTAWEMANRDEMLKRDLKLPEQAQ
ncbi:M28 family peptidase [Niabella beijingensis]|uniref:M28 family peptidase n=1 Tax=Niabella beijingensis TaxID=2872700 RepID=UPI001CBDC553|nr:M28 family peptidase [Niabella beijingensis]MBZ4188780.1 M28 family peptidase [Niabella beijingensis]